jgi:hypothetical protein
MKHPFLTALLAFSSLLLLLHSLELKSSSSAGWNNKKQKKSFKARSERALEIKRKYR